MCPLDRPLQLTAAATMAVILWEQVQQAIGIRVMGPGIRGGMALDIMEALMRGIMAIWIISSTTERHQEPLAVAPAIPASGKREARMAQLVGNGIGSRAPRIGDALGRYPRSAIRMVQQLVMPRGTERATKMVSEGTNIFRRLIKS